jgi:hypothetical protein
MPIFFVILKKNHLISARSRANKKNDNCHVKHKNYTVARKTVGYMRYDTKEEMRIISELYRFQLNRKETLIVRVDSYVMQRIRLWVNFI